MLNRILEILEARRKCRVDFRVGHGGNPGEQLQLAEQRQRIRVSLQLSQNVIEVAE